MAEVRLRAIAFDLFHTLVDPEDFRPSGFRRAPEVARLLGLPESEFVAAWEAQSAERQVTRSPTVLERVQAYCRSRGVSPPPEAWSRVDDLLGRYCDRAIQQPRPAIVASLRELKRRGWTLGLVSNCDEREHRAWPSSALAPLFDATVFSCDVGHAKPSAEAFRALLPRWGNIPLAEAMFVGDGNGGELAGARRAGFARVVFQAGFVSVNGLRPATENEKIRREADDSVVGVEELPPKVGAPAGPREPEGPPRGSNAS